MSSTIDESLVTRLASFEDADAGIAERFHRVDLGGAGTVAVVSTPLAEAHPVGWVICHSFGQEQLHLSRFDVVMARALSAAGFPVLRYHGQGYGDSELGMRHISLDSHLADARDAVDLLRSETGVQRIGMMGVRFGGLVAALVADSSSLPLLCMWEPVTRGAQYMRDYLWSRLFAEWAGTRTGGGIEAILEDLGSQGWADINGFLLTRATHDQVSAMELRKVLTSFRGDALIGSISRSGKVGSGLVKLHEHLQGLGARCELKVVQDEHAAELGRFHYRADETSRTDTQFELAQTVSAATVLWSEGHLHAEISGQEPQ